MERYGPKYEALIPRLMSGTAPACFPYKVITYQFSRPFIVRGVEKYLGDMKPNLWLNDYLTFVELAQALIKHKKTQPKQSLDKLFITPSFPKSRAY